MSTSLPRTCLCLFLFLLWYWLDILRLKFTEFLFLALEESLVPYDDSVELFARDEDIIELL